MLTSTNEVLTDSNYTISWKDGSGNSKTGYIYVHDVTGGSDEFWCNGAHYQDGWTFESPCKYLQDTFEHLRKKHLSPVLYSTTCPKAFNQPAVSETGYGLMLADSSPFP